MRRREFVATGLTGLIVTPARAAAAPAGIAVEIALNGQTYRYDGASGVDLGAYSDPQGQFVQDCFRVDHPQLPLSIFIRPDRGTDRLEVVFELGRLWTTAEPQHLPQYQAKIIRGPATLATVDVPLHYWRSRWRWQSAPRPIRTTAAQLMGQWLMPQLSERLHPVSPPPRSAPEYTPMGLAGLASYMGSTGEREEIGLMTEYQAQYLCTGNEVARDAMFTQAEAAGTYPWNLRDEKTNAPFDTLAYPKATTYGPQAGSPFFKGGPGGKGVAQWDSAHQPALSYLPFLLTGDPYHLEQMQLIASANVLWRPWDYRYRTTQIRGEAWAMRTWAQVAKITPANVPKWMLPQAHWQKVLDSYLDWYLKTFVASPEPARSVFRTTIQVFGSERDAPLSISLPWQDDFLCSVFGWMVLMGHSQWRPVFEWKIGSTIARTNGQSGWLRSYCTPGRIVLRANQTAPWVQSWKEAWDLTVPAENIMPTDPDRLDLSRLFFFPYTRGALVLAKHLQIPNVDPCLEWADGELSRAVAARKPFPYKWALV